MSLTDTRPRRPGLLLMFFAAIVLGAGGALALRRTGDRPPFVGHDASSHRTVAGIGESTAIVLGAIVQNGIRIECRALPVGSAQSNVLREGQDVRFEFTVVDTAGGSPLAKLYPSAWLVSRSDGAAPLSPKETVRIAATLLQGNLLTPSKVDLNVFYVVTLNHNETLSVVDPLFGFGGSKLLALVSLAARGDDWALGSGGRQIFVAMPDANQVALVDTQTWKVTANLPGGIRPHRLSLQPDERLLWVAGGAEGSGDDSGVTVIDPSLGRVVARVRTGRGRHDLAFSDDSRFVFVSNSSHGSVSIIDVATLRELDTIRTGSQPYSLAYSTRARLAYVADSEDGTVTAIDPQTRRIAAKIGLEPGLGQIRFSPDGRAGFVVNVERNTVTVIDPTTNRAVQSTGVQEGPDQVTFTSEFAYIRHRGSVSVVMISLATAGREMAPLSVVQFPAGERPPGAMDDPSPADSIVAAPGASAVLVANACDKSVYYYKEGLSAPMGTFSNYKRAPRAVLVIDRSLRERRRPGVYETTVRIDRAGKFDVVLFVDQPRVVHAFPVAVEADSDLELARTRGQVDIQVVASIRRAQVGQTLRPLFQMSDRSSRALKTGLRDVEILMFRVGGGWHKRRPALEVSPGVYQSEFRPELEGTYHVLVACGSIGLSLNNPEKLVVQIEDPAKSGPPPGLETEASGLGSAVSNDRNDRRNVSR